MKKPATKLTSLFIIAILIPGSILTYFSIQNISNQQDLTEKKLLEEQESVSKYLTNKFHEIIQYRTAHFFNKLDSLNTNEQKIIADLDTLDAVVYSFIINSKGNFIRPLYIESSEANSYQRQYLNQFYQVFSAAQQAEFKNNNFIQAAELFRNGYHVHSPIQEWHPTAKEYGLPQTCCDTWREMDFNKIELSEYMIVCDTMPGWRESVGVTDEIEHAKKNHVPVRYLSQMNFPGIGPAVPM